MMHYGAKLWSMSIALSGLALTWSAMRAADAGREAREVRIEHRRAVAHAAQLVHLRSLVPAGAEPPSPAPELPGRISGIVTSCGLPTSVLASFGSEGTGRRRAGSPVRATLVLTGITLPQLGRFLNAWRVAEPGWAAASIEVTPAGTAPGGGDSPLRAVITLEAAGAENGGEG